jgi:hypothetical protein
MSTFQLGSAPPNRARVELGLECYKHFAPVKPVVPLSVTKLLKLRGLLSRPQKERCPVTDPFPSGVRGWRMRRHADRE